MSQAGDIMGSEVARTGYRVGVVSLGEAGNLGDDLILLAVLSAVSRAVGTSQISFLSHNQRLDFDSLPSRLGLATDIERVMARPEFLWVADNRSLFAHCDVIVFGGGGLLQDSHLADKPYQWLSYLPDGARRRPVLAIGHGIGPLSWAWRERLRKVGSPFDESWVRDSQTQKLSVEELSWPALLTTDFVDDALLLALAERNAQRADDRRTVGVAVRRWPGLLARHLADHVDRIADRHNCKAVTLFVLEAKGGTGPDVDFAHEVLSSLRKTEGEVIIYDSAVLPDFVARMAQCVVAVGMKLHACAIWGHYAIPIYPIIYAPKVASLFGRQYSGLEVVDEVLPVIPENPAGPRASDVLTERLPVIVATSSRNRFSYPLRLRLWHQARRVANSVVIRIPNPFWRSSDS